jgi:hypothetical protein
VNRIGALKADESVTKTSEAFWSLDGSLIICDTPGSNAMEDTLEHNVWIAGKIPATHTYFGLSSLVV